MKHPLTVTFLVLGAGGLFWVTSLYQPGPFEVYDDFEDGADPAWMWEIAHAGQSAIVNDPAGADNRVIYFKIRTDDPIVKKSKRVELKIGTVKMGDSYAYGFKAYLPEDYEAEESSENISQWHGMPDFALLETWRSPPLKIMTRNGRWILSQKVSDLKINKFRFGKGSREVHTEQDLGPAENGKWVSWEFKVRWSYGEDGRLIVLRDGAEVFRYRGMTSYNDWKGPYFKIGMYKPDWTVYPDRSRLTVRDIYFDDIFAKKMDDTFWD
ncbi:MAG: polysaccharide lyase [Verrucomicrobiota bacterium]